MLYMILYEKYTNMFSIKIINLKDIRYTYRFTVNPLLKCLLIEQSIKICIRIYLIENLIIKTSIEYSIVRTSIYISNYKN